MNVTYQKVYGHDNGYYIGIYAAIIVGGIISGLVMSVSFFNVLKKAATTLHDKMFNKLLHAPLEFFEENPTGISMLYVC